MRFSVYILIFQWKSWFIFFKLQRGFFWGDEKASKGEERECDSSKPQDIFLLISFTILPFLRMIYVSPNGWMMSLNWFVHIIIKKEKKLHFVINLL